MERYSYIYGTLEDGMYSRMGGSEALGGFLARIKAVNPGITEDLVRNILGGIKKLDGYDEAPAYDAPLAVRYAPMHLYKRPDMPNHMDAFCAMSISGEEQREGRNSTYSHVFFMDREDMQTGTEEEGRKITYLDQLFGFEWLTAKDMDGHRSKKHPVDYDAVPGTVNPVLRPQDKVLVFQTIRAIYEEKSVVLRLEKNCSFNKRAKQLLIQIYSMMQPRLATEIGFASYQDPAGIPAMSRQTSIRIYLVPAGSKIPEFGRDFVVFDLNQPDSIPGLVKDEMNEVLYRWSILPWNRRQEEMGSIFADTVLNYMDRQLFLDRSQNYLKNEFFAWLRSNQDDKSIVTLEQLFELYNRFPILEKSPWAKSLFLQKLPSLMKEDNALKQMTAQAAAAGMFGEESEKRSQQELYLFAAKKLNAADPLTVGGAVGRLVSQKEREEADLRVANEKKNTEKAVAEGEAAVAAEREKTRKAEAAGKAAVAAAEAAGQAAVAAAEAAGQAAVAEAEAAGKAAVAAAEAAGQAAVAAAEAAGQAAVAAAEAAGQAAVAEAEAAGKAAVAEANAAGEAAVAAEKQNTERVKAAAMEAIQKERQNTAEANTRADAIHHQLAEEVQAHCRTQANLESATAQLLDASQECAGLKERLQNAAQKFQELKQQKLAAEQSAAAAAAEVRRLTSDRERLEAELAAVSTVETRGPISDRERMEFELAAVLNAEEDRKSLNEKRSQRSDMQKKLQSEKKKMFGIGIGIGFGIGAVLFGLILVLMTVLGGNKEDKPPVVTAPPVQTEAFEETVPETTEAFEETVPETTEALMVTGPDFQNWTEDTIDWILKEIPEIASVKTTELEAYAHKGMDHAGYAPIAVFFMDAEDTSDHYAVLMQTVPSTDVDKEGMPEGTVTATETVGEAAGTEGYEGTLCFTYGDLHMAVYGDDAAVKASVDVLEKMAIEPSAIDVVWSMNEISVPVSDFLEKMNVDWTQLDAMICETNELPFINGVQPILQIVCEDHVINVFAVPEETGEADFVQAMESASYRCFIEGDYVAAMAAAVEE